MFNRITGTSCLIVSLTVLGLCNPAWAQVAINQTVAQNGNVTPGDAPGFPVTITQPGSYRLTSNLAVPASTDGIVIESDHVHLDLNGFTIAGGGSGRGVRATSYNATIRNGVVTSFQRGIATFGAGTLIENMHVSENANSGIEAGEGTIVRGSMVHSNGGWGIYAAGTSVVTGNTTFNNKLAGIFAQFDPCVIVGNASRDGISGALCTRSQNDSY
jgi:hypothetical protein